MIDPKPPQFSVQHEPEARRFLIEIEGDQGVLEYRLLGEKMIFTHTSVPSHLEGLGIASRLARSGLDYARVQGYKVVPLCWFIADYIRKNPEYKELME